MANRPLSRSLDVVVNVTKQQIATATDMKLACLLTASPSFDRISRTRIYQSLAEFAEDIPANTTAYMAGVAFFSQEARAPALAVGKIYTEDQPAVVYGGQGIDIDALKLVTAGSMVIQVGESATTLTSLDFSSCTDIDDVVDVLGSLASAHGDSGVKFTSADADGDQVAAFATAHTTGTDVSALLKLTEATAAGKENGYDYVSLIDEAERVQNAAAGLGRKIFGWLLDAEMRTAEIHAAFGAWALANDYIAGFTSNASALTSGGSTTDSASVLKTADNSACFVVYHDNAQYFPEASAMAKVLGVDYGGTDTTIDMKFKRLPGVPPVYVTSTELGAILAKRANVLTDTEGSMCYRDGTQAAAGWPTSVWVDIRNLVEELRTAVFNVFLKNLKVPYTFAGQMLQVSAATKVLNKYVRNGVLADRRVEDADAEGGYVIEPAFTVTPSPIEGATDADRAAHIAPSIGIVCNLSGAMHKVTVNMLVVE